jgi:hypothetical protein
LESRRVAHACRDVHGDNRHARIRGARRRLEVRPRKPGREQQQGRHPQRQQQQILQTTTPRLLDRHRMQETESAERHHRIVPPAEQVQHDRYRHGERAEQKER